MISKGIRVLVWSMLLVAQLDAQSHRSVIRGRVQDASSAVVAGAAVTVVNEATNETRATTSGDAGAFALAELAPGAWRVEIGRLRTSARAARSARGESGTPQTGALLKRVPFGGRTSLQLRAEAFNLLNRTNFDLPDNFYGSPTFGHVLSAGPPRHIQFGARFAF